VALQKKKDKKYSSKFIAKRKTRSGVSKLLNFDKNIGA
jgi:hypothetical protein